MSENGKQYKEDTNNNNNNKAIRKWRKYFKNRTTVLFFKHSL